MTDEIEIIGNQVGSDEPEFSLQEKLDFLNDQVNLFESIAEIFKTSDMLTKGEIEREIALMKSIRDEIQFSYMLNQIATAEDQPWLEETGNSPETGSSPASEIVKKSFYVQRKKRSAQRKNVKQY